jgi:hypothetical protein
MKVRKNVEVFIVGWGFFSLTSITFLSNQNLIDGISYFKVALAAVMISLVFPYLGYRLICLGKTKFVLLALATLSLITVFSLSDGQNNYRDLFGAPGRSNGIISYVNFIAFLFFGSYLALLSKVRSFVKTLSWVSFGISFTVLITTRLDLFRSSALASWNLNNPDFQENTNLIAPLIIMGIIATSYDIKLGQLKIAILKLLPQMILLIEFGLLQSVFAAFAGLVVYLIFNKKPHFKPIVIPFAVIPMYILGLALTSFSIFQGDSSLKERRDIIFFQEMYKDFTILPKNVDALSDYSSTFNSSQILDDYHNVIIQLSFSLGLLGGIFFLWLIFMSFRNFDTKSELGKTLLSTYSAFFVSLLVGIVSPNYIYFGAILIGIGLFQSTKVSAVKDKISRKEIPALLLVSFISITTLVIQVDDYLVRREISSITLLKSPSEIDKQRLVLLSNSIEDSGIRYLVARNFFSVGDCIKGSKILNQMRETNQREIRIGKLQPFKDSCITADPGP